MKRNLIGQKFNRLTVIDKAPDYVSPSGTHFVQWKCRCECGNEIVTREHALLSGHTKGCGRKHRRYEDLTGKKFGKLTVLSQAEDEITSKGRQIRWLCRCECGNEIITRGTSLRNGHTRSCGCLHSEAAMGIGLIDITGQKFGKWTVLYENGRLREPMGRLVPLWHCRCECGTERDLRAGTLRQGLSLSCGCYKYERLKMLSGQGFKMSKAEVCVNSYLSMNNFYYESQKIYSDLKSDSGYPLSYDFLVYKNGKPFLLIECQGKQHYEPVEYFGGEKQFLIQQKNDAYKKNYAKEHNIPLLEIPYTYNNDLIIQLLKSHL